MAVYREKPKCPFCGAEIKGIYKDQSSIARMQQLVGDAFIKWDWEGHVCNKKIKFKRTVK